MQHMDPNVRNTSVFLVELVMSEVNATVAGGAAWVEPEVRELPIDETHATPPNGADGGPYPTSQS